jgi:DeoR/GlpR family transcriptional regulator of sugar metabolism
LTYRDLNSRKFGDRMKDPAATVNPSSAKSSSGGGAGWSSRLEANSELKQAAAEKCMALGVIRPFEHLFLDCGSTFVYLANEVFSAARRISGLTVSTTNAEIFKAYMEHPNRDFVIFNLLGGQFVPHHHSFDGAHFVASPPSAPRFDRAFVGVAMVDAQHQLLADVTDTVQIKQKVIASSREIIILCDQTKFDGRGVPSRAVTRLSRAENGLCIDFDGRKIPTRVVIGVSGTGARPPGLTRFLGFAAPQGDEAQSSVVFAEA